MNEIVDQKGYYTFWSWTKTDITLFLMKGRQLTVYDTDIAVANTAKTDTSVAQDGFRRNEGDASLSNQRLSLFKQQTDNVGRDQLKCDGTR